MPIDQLQQLKNPADIRNKIKREDVYLRQKQLKSAIKKKVRVRRAKEEENNPKLKQNRIEANVPKTLETMRAKDETLVDPEDEEILADEEQDEFASYFTQGIEPKVLITTSKKAHEVSCGTLRPSHLLGYVRLGL